MMVVMVLVEMVVADIVAVAVAVGVAVVGVVVVVGRHCGMRVCVVDVDGCVALLGNIYKYCI